MKKLFLTLAISLVGLGYTFACTNLIAGKNATVDGSTLISYAADSYGMYGALYHFPAAEHKPGTMRPIYEWDTGRYLGEIPEAARTYNVIGNMNEFQLTIGETTWGGRDEQIDTTGLIDYGSLIYMALQRCKTAREALDFMTSIVQEYGYCSSGESFSIGDPNEVWILEMIGKGVGNKGTVWVATRVPDACVSAHANQARITQINFKDKENWRWSKDVIDFAREQGYYKGSDKDFSFSDTYNPLDMSGLYICEARVWSFFRQVNAEMDKYLSYVMGETKERMPLYIVPDKKVSAQDFKNYMRDQYEGTPLDITKGTDAGPWGSKLRYGSLGFKVDSVQYWFERPIATQQTAWSFVAQMRGYMPDHIGGIFWFGVDDAATSLYVPFYCHTTSVPYCFAEGNGDYITYSPTSAFWAFNFVANWAYNKYSRMLPDIRRVQEQWEAYFDRLVLGVDQSALEMNPEDASAYLTQFSSTQAEAVTKAWIDLGHFLMMKYMDGQEQKEENGVFLRDENGRAFYPNRPTYPVEYLRAIAPEVEHE